MKLYVYYLSGGSSVQEAESVSGVAGGAVRLMSAGQLTVAVSEFAGDAVAITRENVLAHERVVRSVLRHTTPLPFRFGTLATEAQLQSYLQSQQELLQSKLQFVSGCVEMSVKIIWPGADANREVPAFRINHSLDSRKDGAGAAFLKAKRREGLGEQIATAKATEIASWLKARLAPSIRKDQVTIRSQDKLVLAAAHLVDRSFLDNYRLELRKARDERPDLHFLTSGPWPPYSFVNIDLEFKTQFGVS